MEILFKNATVVTMDEADAVLENTDVGICGGKIRIAPAEKTAARVIDCTYKVLMPGLYNCHTHAGMTLFRGYANDRALEDWLFNHLIPAEAKLTPELVRTGTLLAMAEMLASGTVAFSDMYYSMPTTARAACEVGMLANICNGLMETQSVDDYWDGVLETARELEDGENNGRVKTDVHIHGCYTSPPAEWRQKADFAKKNNLRMQVHLSETKTEHENCVKNFGKTPAAIFAEHGVFDVPCTAAHGVWATDGDIAILVEKNVTVAHNPLSNLKLASGLAPVAKMLAGGVNVALGTDGVASNNSHDLFEELKMASLLQKFAKNDPTAVPAAAALRMATTNGARAQGRENESGKIADGFDADMLLLDFNNPRQTMCYAPMLNLAYSTSGRDVEMTMVRGRILYEKGEFLTIDIEKVLHGARAAKKIFLC